MLMPLDFADRIRREHRVDVAAARAAMEKRLRDEAASSPGQVDLDYALSILYTDTPPLRPMSTVAAHMSADIRYLQMPMIHGTFEATVLGKTEIVECHCIAGWALELYALANYLPDLATGQPMDSVKFRPFGTDFALAADTILASCGHTAAAARHIDYFASNSDGRRQVTALAELEAQA